MYDWLSFFFQIKAAIRDREKAMEMKSRLLRIVGDRDIFLEKLAETRKKAFEVQHMHALLELFLSDVIEFRKVDLTCKGLISKK